MKNLFFIACIVALCGLYACDQESSITPMDADSQEEVQLTRGGEQG